MTDNSWESLCRQCGLCCFEKFETDSGTIFYTQTPCRYLDVVTRECSIYEKRFTINPECMKLTPELVATLRWLPRDCGYVIRTPKDEPRPLRKSPRRKKRG